MPENELVHRTSSWQNLLVQMEILLVPDNRAAINVAPKWAMFVEVHVQVTRITVSDVTVLQYHECVLYPFILHFVRQIGPGARFSFAIQLELYFDNQMENYLMVIWDYFIKKRVQGVVQQQRTWCWSPWTENSAISQTCNAQKSVGD